MFWPLQANLRVMKLATAALAASSLLTVGGCGRGSESLHVFTSPVLLSEVLAVPGVRDDSTQCEFEITEEQGRPVSNALLRLDWPEANRMAFQTDQYGRITLCLCDELDATGATLSAETKPVGQDLLESSYEESTQRIAGAHIVLRLLRD